jgi:hypothetical protein
VALNFASKESIKEGMEDSIKPRGSENNIKLSIKKVGMGTEGGERGEC